MLPEQEATSAVMQYVFKGGEVAIKITGAAAKNLAMLLLALLQQKNRTKGRVNIGTLVQQNTPLVSFPVPKDRLKEFCEMAKPRGIMYAFIHDKKMDKAAASMDVMAKQNDAVLLKEIFEKLGWGELSPSGNYLPQRISREERIANERAGVITAYDPEVTVDLVKDTKEVKEVKESNERPTSSGRRNALSAQKLKNTQTSVEQRPSVRAKLQAFSEMKTSPTPKVRGKVKQPSVPTK